MTSAIGDVAALVILAVAGAYWVGRSVGYRAATEDSVVRLNARRRR